MKAGAGKEREKSKDDITCEGISAYADTLSQSVGQVQQNIASLTSKTKGIGPLRVLAVGRETLIIFNADMWQKSRTLGLTLAFHALCWVSMKQSKRKLI